MKIAAVRSTVVPSSTALQVASRQYVDSAVASKAADTGVVHIAGQETIAATKQFATSPGVPAPQQSGDAMTGPRNLSGDSLQVNAPSQTAQFAALVREVAIEVVDASSDTARYKISFANEAAESVTFQFEANSTRAIPVVPAIAQDLAMSWSVDLVSARITQVSSTTTTIDIGQSVPIGYGVEVRRTDSGGPDNDRNLVGRFTTQGFTVPRPAKRQDYFLRLFDASAPPNYSQHSALLHIDYPY